MTAHLSSHTAYAEFIYGLLTDRPSVESHTVAVYTVGQTIGIVRGEVRFHSGHRLRIFEQVDFLENRILKYSYEVAFDGEKLWWYDPMPHPRISELQTNHPHHKHVPPDIKHNRILALEISFTRPNLSYLISEVENAAIEC
ncbi:hypothetical protein KFU94_43830 [Chloroflexi bacterium TSY]|nr:hypothetical protein [Chloroflexi bacterium TSY]